MKHKLQLLSEMPWATGCQCPQCTFKFGADFEIERLTDNKEINQKYMDLFFKIRLISLHCPNCEFLMVHDFTTNKTYDYEDIMAILNKEDPKKIPKKEIEYISELIKNSHISIKNLKVYLTVLKNLLQTRLEVGRSVIPENLYVEMIRLLKDIENQTLTFEDFVNSQEY